MRVRQSAEPRCFFAGVKTVFVESVLHIYDPTVLETTCLSLESVHAVKEDTDRHIHSRYIAGATSDADRIIPPRRRLVHRRRIMVASSFSLAKGCPVAILATCSISLSRRRRWGIRTSGWSHALHPELYLGVQALHQYGVEVLTRQRCAGAELKFNLFICLTIIPTLSLIFCHTNALSPSPNGTPLNLTPYDLVPSGMSTNSTLNLHAGCVSR